METEAEVEIPSTFNFGIDFMNASESVLLMAAFIIGFFSKLAQALLKQIARFIFGNLFDKTYERDILINKDVKSVHTKDTNG